MMVRSATGLDVDALVSLIERLAPMPTKADSLRVSLGAYLSHPKAAVLVAVNDSDIFGALVGMVMVEDATSWANFDATEARAHCLLVEPEYRRKGVASMLLNECEQWARLHKCPRLTVGFEGDAEVAMPGLLEAHGLRPHEHWFRREVT